MFINALIILQPAPASLDLCHCHVIVLCYKIRVCREIPVQSRLGQVSLGKSRTGLQFWVHLYKLE